MQRIIMIWVSVTILEETTVCPVHLRIVVRGGECLFQACLVLVPATYVQVIIGASSLRLPTASAHTAPDSAALSARLGDPIRVR